MPENQFKRNIAYKLRIGNLLQGQPVIDNDKFTFLDLNNKKVIRVNIIGNIVDKIESEPREGSGGYIFMTLDDGSGQISIKSFGDDAKKLKELTQGNTVLIIGSLRHFNDQLYVQPEIIKVVDAEYLLLRKLEVEKEQTQNQPMVYERKEASGVKDKILELIKAAEPEGGIDIDKIILEVKDSPPDLINREVHRLLEDGIIFEPRPGKLRFLG